MVENTFAYFGYDGDLSAVDGYYMPAKLEYIRKSYNAQRTPKCLDMGSTVVMTEDDCLGFYDKKIPDAWTPLKIDDGGDVLNGACVAPNKICRVNNDYDFCTNAY